MLGSYVCRQCRARLSRHVTAVKSPQWQSRATFLSLRQHKSDQNAATSTTEASPEARSDGARTGVSDRPDSQYGDLVDQSRPRERLGRYSKHAQDDVEDQYGVPMREESEWVGAEDSIEDTMERQGPAVAISSALEKRNLRRAWAMFQEHFTSKDCPALMEPSLGDAAWLANGKIFLRLLQATNKGFCWNKNEPVVTPTELLLRYEQLGIAFPEFWGKQTLSFFTLQVMMAANGVSRDSSRDLEPLLLELLSLWRAFFQMYGSQPISPEALSAEWCLPASSSLPDVFDNKHFQRRLQHFHPNFPFDFSLSLCATYLYTLSDAFRAQESLQTAAEPFLQVLSRLLAGSSVQAVLQRLEQLTQFNTLPAEAQQEIRQELSDAPGKALKEVGTRVRTPKRAPEEKRATRRTKEDNQGAAHAQDEAGLTLEEAHLKRMARAIKSRESADALESLWRSALKDFREGDKPAITSRLYNSFLTGFMVLRRADRTVEIWNHMIANDVKPDNKSWVALLDGCAKAKDLQALNAIWSRMLSTGVEPDNYLWTVRVHGLAAMGQMTACLAALDDMGNRWRAGEQPAEMPQKASRNSKAGKNISTKTINKCTKPTIEVINGAMSAIVQRSIMSLSHGRRKGYIQQILAWASNFDIQPDAITYNTLFNMYLRAGDSPTAFKILKQMEKEGIAPDVATYNMLLSAAFDNAAFSGLSKPEQTARVIAHLESLEQGGLKLSEHNYSTAIDRLLKKHSNYEAVADILDHMAERNLVPSPHVYTSLMTYYFQLDPPAIPAVDALLNRIFTSHRIPTDQYLFDRALEGYGSHGEVGRMMSVLTRMSKHGRVPGWQAFTAVVEALVHDGDTHRAHEVVRDVIRTEGVAKGGIIGGSAGESNFFAAVKALGVGLEEERMGDFMVGDRTDTPEDVSQASIAKDVEQMEPKEVAQPPAEDVHDGFLSDK